MTAQVILKYLGSLFSFAADILINIRFFGCIPNKDTRRNAKNYLPLLLLFFLFFTPESLMDLANTRSFFNYIFQSGRLVYRWVIVYSYIRLSKNSARETALYMSGFSTVIYVTAQNIRILLQRTVQFAGASIDLSVLTFLGILVEFLLFRLVKANIDLREIRSVGRVRWALLILCSFLAVYFKWILVSTIAFQTSAFQWRDLLAFAFFSSTGVFLALVLNESAQQASEGRNKAQMERLTMEYEMQNAKRALQTNNDIRRLYHDMKNHLLAIRSMAGTEDDIQHYLDELLPQFDGYESRAATGNPVVDALLSEKIQRASLDGIQFNVCLDLSSLEYVKSVDLITIFGNALDNAIEAVQTLPDNAERIIYLKSSHFANLTVLRFSNRFTGEIKQENNILLTDKDDRSMHGIGLSSITRAVQKYEGSVEIRIDKEKKWFSLMLLFPDS